MTSKQSCSEVRSLLIDTVWREDTAREDDSAWKEESVRENTAVPLGELSPWVTSHLDSCPGCRDFFRELQHLREWAIGANMKEAEGTLSLEARVDSCVHIP